MNRAATLELLRSEVSPTSSVEHSTLGHTLHLKLYTGKRLNETNVIGSSPQFFEAAAAREAESD
jgi:hypothetical protein